WTLDYPARDEVDPTGSAARVMASRHLYVGRSVDNIPFRCESYTNSDDESTVCFEDALLHNVVKQMSEEYAMLFTAVSIPTSYVNRDADIDLVAWDLETEEAQSVATTVGNTDGDETTTGDDSPYNMLLSTMSVTSDRQDKALFTFPYMVSKFGVVVNNEASSLFDLSSMAYLDNKVASPCCVTTGSAAAFLRDYGWAEAEGTVAGDGEFYAGASSCACIQ
ncbi:hypothetical protein KIPB_014168, partial [Kipferlia bialata]